MMLYRRLATLAVLGTAHCFPQSVASASSPYYSKRDELVDINRRQGLEWLDQAIASRSVLSEIEEREIDDEYHFFERSTDELFDRGSLLFARAFGARPPPVPPKPESLRTSSVTPGSSSTAQRPTTGGSSAPSPPSGPPPGRPPVPVAPVPGAPATGANSAPPPPSRPPPAVPGAPPTPGTSASSAPPSRPPPPVPGTSSAASTPPPAGSPPPPGPPAPGSQPAPSAPGSGRAAAPNLHPEGGIDWTKKVQDDAAKANKGGSKDPANPVPNLEQQAAQRAHDTTGFNRDESDKTDIENNKAGIRNQKMAEIDKMNAAELMNYNNKMKYFNTGKDIATVGIAGTVASHTLGLLRRELAKREVIAREAYALYLSLGDDELY